MWQGGGRHAQDRLVTFDVSHESIGWLKAEAEQKVPVAAGAAEGLMTDLDVAGL